VAKCAVCGKPASMAEAPTGRPLCKEHFFQSVRERAKKEVKGVKGKILLAVSGGKDSLVLMDVMAHIYDPSELVAVTVVEGAPGYYREEERRNAHLLAKKLDIEYYYVTFKDIYGKSLEELAKAGKQRPCTYCGVLRRRAIEMVAMKLGIKNVATGHTLDDEIHTSLLNLLRGDWEGIRKLNQGRLKPLRRVFEREVAAYAYLKRFPFQREECPFLYMNPSLRSRTRMYLFEAERGNYHKFYRWIERLSQLSAPALKLGRCKLCGFPTSPGREICRACELGSEVGIDIPSIKEIDRIRLRRP